MSVFCQHMSWIHFRQTACTVFVSLTLIITGTPLGLLTFSVSLERAISLINLVNKNVSLQCTVIPDACRSSITLKKASLISPFNHLPLLTASRSSDVMSLKSCVLRREPCSSLCLAPRDPTQQRFPIDMRTLLLAYRHCLR